MGSPQAALRLQNVAAVLLAIIAVLILAVMGVIAYGFMLGLGFIMVFLGLILISAFVLYVSAVSLTMGVRRDLRAHIRSDGGHFCQCRNCGRTFAPVGPPVDIPARAVQTPQERIRSSEALLKAIPSLVTIGVLCFVVIFAQVLYLEYLSATLVIAQGVVAALLLVAVAVGGGWLRRRIEVQQQLLGDLPPWHGCTCRWCNAPGATS